MADTRHTTSRRTSTDAADNDKDGQHPKDLPVDETTNPDADAEGPAKSFAGSDVDKPVELEPVTHGTYSREPTGDV